VSTEGVLASALLLAIVVLAIVSTRVVGRRAARTVDQVTALLERNEARFRAMVRDSNDIMAIVDTQGRLVYASPVTERILGLDVEPLVGTDVFDLIHPDDRDAARRAFKFTREGKEADRVEVRLRRADGGWRVMEAIATNMLDDPAVEGIVISARDLTDRRQAEAELREAQERFRSAFEHAPIGMALMSIDGRLFRVNRALVQILGRGESELLASSMLDLCYPDDRDVLRESMSRLFGGKTQNARIEQRFVHHDGHPVWVSVSASLVRDVNDQPMYLVCQVEDIGERWEGGQRIESFLTSLAALRLLDRRREGELPTTGADATGPTFALLSEPDDEVVDWVLRQRRPGQAGSVFAIGMREAVRERFTDAGWLCVGVLPGDDPADAWRSSSTEAGYIRGAH